MLYIATQVIKTLCLRATMNYKSIHVHNFCFSTHKSIMYIHYFLKPKKIKVLNNFISPILWGDEFWNGNEEPKIARFSAPEP